GTARAIGDGTSGGPTNDARAINRTVFKASKRQTRDDDERSSRSSMDMQFDSKWTRDGTSPSYRRLHGSDSSLYSTASHRGSPHASDSRIRFPLQKTRTL
uniref:Uncharacterized protein n=1 Tax=Parascaris equorum TaxID=6256 RepID=A0A914RR19_PAREQ